MKTSVLIEQLQLLSKAGEDHDVKIETRTSGYEISGAYMRILPNDSHAQIFLVLVPNERKPRAQRSPASEPSAFDSTRSL